MPSALAVLSSAFLLALMVAGGSAIYIQQGSQFSRPGQVGGPFAMTDLDGKPVTQEDLKGRPTVLFFGFTQCPEVCPTTLTNLSGAMARMGRDADRLNAVFVTLDPDRDTPEVLRTYLTAFDPRIRALVGTPAQVERMADTFHIRYRRVPTRDGDYTIEHSAGIALFDRTGRIVGEIPYDENEDQTLAKLFTLAFPGQCHPAGGVSLWNGASDGTCRSG